MLYKKFIWFNTITNTNKWLDQPSQPIRKKTQVCIALRTSGGREDKRNQINWTSFEGRASRCTQNITSSAQRSSARLQNWNLVNQYKYHLTPFVQSSHHRPCSSLVTWGWRSSPAPCIMYRAVHSATQSGLCLTVCFFLPMQRTVATCVTTTCCITHSLHSINSLLPAFTQNRAFTSLCRLLRQGF